MIGKGMGVLLYDHYTKLRKCVTSSLERELGVELSFSFEKSVGDVILESYTQIVDMSTSSSGVYKLRRASQLDMVECQ